MTDDELDTMVRASDRIEMWIQFVQRHQSRAVAELGVARGIFAEALLSNCPEISTYYLIDPWRHLEDWNKPANRDDHSFEAFYEETMARTEPWTSARVVLRGRTTEVIHSIPDESLDFAYVDGDHTLRGITVDLLRIWPKVKVDGFIGGDDFCPSIWQHTEGFEPTLVFPFAVHFAEAMDTPIAALPNNQFVIQKSASGFDFVDKTGRYGDLTLQGSLGEPPSNKGLRLPKQFLRRTGTNSPR